MLTATDLLAEGFNHIDDPDCFILSQGENTKLKLVVTFHDNSPATCLILGKYQMMSFPIHTIDELRRIIGNSM